MANPTIKTHLPPVSPATSFTSFSSVTFDVPERLAPLEMRVLAPVTGDNLPVLLFSHGHGDSNFIASMRGYGPLVDFYASHGFVVIMPTHQNSKTLGLDLNGPEGALFMRSRAKDMRFILDHLDEIETSVPGLAGRIDRDRIAAVGHSLGGHTVAMLSGMTVKDQQSGEDIDLSDPRIKTAVMFSPPGDGADASPKISQLYPELVNNDFTGMKIPALVITGDKDINPMFSERADWRADAFRLSPGPKSLLFLFEAGHLFGGISGYDAAETTDESPERVAAIQRITWAYLRTGLYPGDHAWAVVSEELAKDAHPAGWIKNK